MFLASGSSSVKLMRGYSDFFKVTSNTKNQILLFTYTTWNSSSLLKQMYLYVSDQKSYPQRTYLFIQILASVYYLPDNLHSLI